MNSIQKYYEILEKTNSAALATSLQNTPNVRIVNFVYDIEHPGVLYFASNRTNRKVSEFEQNNKIAFTTIPTDDIQHIRSQKAIIQKSKFSIDEMKDLFIKRIPGYDETIEAIGDTLDVFEIHVQEATIISGFGEPETICF